MGLCTFRERPHARATHAAGQDTGHGGRIVADCSLCRSADACKPPQSRVTTRFAGTALWSPLPVLRGRVRVGAFSFRSIRNVDNAPTPTLPRSTGRGGKTPDFSPSFETGSRVPQSAPR